VSGGETDLAVLLASMAPVLHPEPHDYVAIVPQEGPPPGWLAMVREPEGLFAVAPVAEGGFARISLTVHSALEAVGLTAAMSTALAARGIAANIIAGKHHDHILVRLDRADDAMAALVALSADPRLVAKP
jgi:uncharacterized protein